MGEFRHALRGLWRSPGFTAIAVMTLALGIGAGTAIFSVVNGVLLSALPYPNPDGLVQVSTVNQFGRAVRVSFPDFEDLRDENESFAELAAHAAYSTSASVGGDGFRTQIAQVTPAFFPVFGVSPGSGRAFSAEEGRVGAPLAVVSHAFWQGRLRGALGAATPSIRIGETLYTVIGVMPAEFDFPAGTAVWVPRTPLSENRTAHNWSVIGRLRNGVSLDLGQQDLSAIAQQLKQRHGDDTDTTDATVRPILESLVGDVRPALLVLLGAAGMLLILACVNVANLFLARAFSRDRELAVRLALGARPGSLVRAFLAESLLATAAGAALGVLIAAIGVPALVAFEPGWLPRSQDIAVDWAVLAAASLTSVFLAVAIALVPGLRAARHGTHGVLAGGQRIQGEAAAGRRLRSSLAAAQVALTAVLLVGAGLLGRSVLELLSVDPGFRTEGVLVLDSWLPYPESDDPEIGAARIADFIDRFSAGLRGIPGVERVGGINHFPLRGGGPNGTFVVVQAADEITDFDRFFEFATDAQRAGNAEFRVADGDYFRVMDIPLVQGRLFDERDAADAPHVAVISESLAAARWPNEDPIGRQVFFGNMDGDLRSFTVVGVVGDVKEYGLGAAPLPTFYANYRQRPRTAAEFHVAVRGSFDAAELTASARRIARDIDAEVPVESLGLEAIVSRSLADRRFVLVLLAVFGSLALGLAATGVYSVMAYLVLQRTPEMGVRMALGAQKRNVTSLLLQHGARLAIAGIVTGLLAAFGLSRVLRNLLYGVNAADTMTFAVTTAVLLIAALTAAWIPARRVARANPITALRRD